MSLILTQDRALWVRQAIAACWGGNAAAGALYGVDTGHNGTATVGFTSDGRVKVTNWSHTELYASEAEFAQAYGL